jgi:hypothetical protein
MVTLQTAPVKGPFLLCQNYYVSLGRHAPAFSRKQLPSKENMSAKIDFKVKFKGKLNHQLATLLAASDLESAQRVFRASCNPTITFTGTFAHIEPYFEPITPKLMLKFTC